MSLIDRLRRSYVDHGTNYVQEAADEIERLTAHDQFLADANKQWIADCERLTAELARAKEYHAAELADVVAERDSLQAQLTNIWK